MATKLLLVDRDGTLIEEPDDEQVDSTAKVRLLPGVIPALLSLQAARVRRPASASNLGAVFKAMVIFLEIMVNASTVASRTV